MLCVSNVSRCWKADRHVLYIIQSRITLKGQTIPNKIKAELPVSSLACKEPGHCHSILTISKKTEETEKSKRLLNLSEKWVSTQGEPRHQTGETARQIQRNTTYWSRNLHENQYWDRKTWTVTDEFLEAQKGHIWDVKTLGGGQIIGGSYTFWSFTFRSSIRFPHWRPKKNSIPLCFQVEERKRKHNEIHQRILFFVRPALKRNYFVRAYPSEVLSQPYTHEARKILNSSSLFLCKGRDILYYHHPDILSCPKWGGIEIHLWS